MARIDRDALGIGKADKSVFEYPEYADGWNSAIEIVNNAAVVDAVPVVHARWIPNRVKYKTVTGDYAYSVTGYVCSRCGYDYPWYDLDCWLLRKPKYCEECGAKMDTERVRDATKTSGKE